MIDIVKATSTITILLELENRLWATIGNLCLMIIIHEFDNRLSMQTILSWNLVLFRWYNNNSLEAILQKIRMRICQTFLSCAEQKRQKG